MADAETLPDKLFGLGIKPKRWGPGTSSQIRCPWCDGGRTREVSLTVTIDEDNLGATWICHRATCGEKGGARLHREGRPTHRPSHPTPRDIKRPPGHAPDVTSNKPEWLYAFFAERNIGARTVDAFGCYAVKRWFGEEIGERPTIVFPYVWRGEIVNRKYRPFPQKQPQQQEKDALQTLFNIDSIGESLEVVWVEGEPDVMALFECGITCAVSLKDGAPPIGTTNHDKRFEAFEAHSAELEPVRRFILAGDMDEPGLLLREELARRLGRHRCWLVTWPDGCKDACDTLRRDGPDAVLDCIQGAVPYPIEGLQRVSGERLLALRRSTPPTTMTTGTYATDHILSLPTEGRLILVTGYPSAGKTVWTRFVMIHTAARHARRWAVFSPEMQPWEHFAAECAEVWVGKPFWPVHGIVSMADDEIKAAGEWLGDRMTMIVCDAEGQSPTLDWLLDRAKLAVLRDGVTDFLFDPWNEGDHQRAAGMTETDYIGRALQRLKAFGLRHGCNVWIIAHPAKPVGLKPGEKKAAPGPYDIAASAHWANKTDLGITVHSPTPGAAEIHIWKARFKRWGKKESAAALDFDELTGRYTDPARDPDL